NSRQQWKQFYEIAQQKSSEEKTAAKEEDLYGSSEAIQKPSIHHKILLYEPYLVSTLKSGVLFIHTGRAQERIMYERLQAHRTEEKPMSQQLVLPVQVAIYAQDSI